MDNQKILLAIMESIKAEIAKQGLSQDEVAVKSGIAQGTISNTLSKPASAKVSTLLKICDGLNLSLFAIFRSVNNALDFSNGNNLIYDVSNTAFNGYLGTMYVYFLETTSTRSDKLLYGEIKLGDFYHTKECIARLQIDTNDKDENGNIKYKMYEGNVVINPNKSIFFHLSSNKLGDIWSLAFNHDMLNSNNLACSLGCAVTLSSGKSTRYPTIHFVCLSKSKLSPAEKEIITNRLHIHNKELIISESNLKKFLTTETLDQTFRENLETCTQRRASKAYIVPFSSLSTFVDDPNVAYEMITKLLQYSWNETAYQVLPKEDTKLFQAIH